MDHASAGDGESTQDLVFSGHHMIAENGSVLAEKAVKEAKEIAKAREALDETTEKINALKAKTDRLFDDMNREKSKIMSFMNLDYLSLREEDKLFLGTLVNHTLSLSQLLNETIE